MKNSHSDPPPQRSLDRERRRERLEFGFAKEREIAERLKLSGYRILAAPYRIRGGELDIVAEQVRENGSLELVFVEVRARREGGALESLSSHQKQRRLIRAARHFMVSYRGAATRIRWDLWVWETARGWEQALDVKLA